MLLKWKDYLHMFTDTQSVFSKWIFSFDYRVVSFIHWLQFILFIGSCLDFFFSSHYTQRDYRFLCIEKKDFIGIINFNIIGYRVKEKKINIHIDAVIRRNGIWEKHSKPGYCHWFSIPIGYEFLIFQWLRNRMHRFGKYNAIDHLFRINESIKFFLQRKSKKIADQRGGSGLTRLGKIRHHCALFLGKITSNIFSNFSNIPKNFHWKIVIKCYI